jgi:hypothetical protein
MWVNAFSGHAGYIRLQNFTHILRQQWEIIMRKLKINRSDFVTAFELGDLEATSYLDTETGTVIIMEDYASTQLEKYLSEGDELDAVLANLRGDETLYDWERDMLIAVAEVEFSRDLDRYKLIPRQDSRDGYRDMQEYVWSLEDAHLREVLEVAIQGSGAFRRFKDALYRYPEAEENWFKFRDERVQQRMIDWLESEGIEPEFE